jgi:hypothetical protein
MSSFVSYFNCNVCELLCTSCKETDPDNVYSGDSVFMTADYSVSCSSARYQFAQVWASAMIVVYPVGVPCFYLYLLYSSKDAILGRLRNSLALKTSGEGDTLDAAGVPKDKRMAGATEEQSTADDFALVPLRNFYETYLPKRW